MIAFTILSFIQIAALLYLGIASIRINRMQTLSKNFEWVIQNRTFIEKYHYPILWPLFVSAVVIGGIMIAGLLKQSSDLLLWEKYIGILSAFGITTVLYYIIEKRVSSKIPLRKERSASLVKRTLGYYVHPALVTISKGATLLVIGAEIAMLLFHGISRATLLIDLTNALFAYSMLFGGIYWALIEKIPHGNDISTVTKINVGENYRKFSLNLLSGMIVVVSLLFLFQLVLQWNGFDIAISSLKGPLSIFFGETSQQYKPIFTLFQWDMISSGLSIPLFIYIAHCKPFRDILAIKIQPN
jgi:hypothetical protein